MQLSSHTINEIQQLYQSIPNDAQLHLISMGIDQINNPLCQADSLDISPIIYFSTPKQYIQYFALGQ